MEGSRYNLAARSTKSNGRRSCDSSEKRDTNNFVTKLRIKTAGRECDVRVVDKTYQSLEKLQRGCGGEGKGKKN